ncbi:MAG: glycosyltransferase family 39 protein, partial [Opitutales bacterium]|nr:glycosyltransferase family 39 protein [Opitutales bacterium]
MIVCGLFLRIENAQSRILHSDEAVQAYQLRELMETGDYRYDPKDKHGPLLYYFASALNKGLDIESAELSRVSLRLLPILASVGLIIFLLTLLREFSFTTLLGSSFMALSPLPVIYGAYFVQEALFVLIGFLLLYSCFTFWNRQSPVRAAIVGLLTGAFFLTKETAIIHIAAIALVVFIAFPTGRRLESWQKAARLPNLAAGLVSFVLIWVLFYSSGFKDFSQVGDSFKAFINYAERAQGAGHEKPFFYYLSIMWPHTAEGVRWGEALFLLLSFAGLIVTLLDRRSLDPRIQIGILYGF